MPVQISALVGTTMEAIHGQIKDREFNP
ncbi:hypothetical protein BO1005MUT1_530091 [Hyphomicrobiales bacterium]|nr:hypothetical protein BO1005MUT1_530091 [Hyphomicrobiales bacterium]